MYCLLQSATSRIVTVSMFVSVVFYVSCFLSCINILLFVMVSCLLYYNYVTVSVVCYSQLPYVLQLCDCFCCFVTASCLLCYNYVTLSVVCYTQLPPVLQLCHCFCCLLYPAASCVTTMSLFLLFVIASCLPCYNYVTVSVVLLHPAASCVTTMSLFLLFCYSQLPPMLQLYNHFCCFVTASCLLCYNCTNVVLEKGNASVGSMHSYIHANSMADCNDMKTPADMTHEECPTETHICMYSHIVPNLFVHKGKCI